MGARDEALPGLPAPQASARLREVGCGVVVLADALAEVLLHVFGRVGAGATEALAEAKRCFGLVCGEERIEPDVRDVTHAGRGS